MGATIADAPAAPAASVELALADTQPFGDPDYIWTRLSLHYRRRLEMLAEYSEHAAELLTGMDQVPPAQHARVLGDPLVRVAIDSSLSHFRLGAEETPELDLGTVARMAVENLELGRRSPPLSEATRGLSGLPQGTWPWLWSNERAPIDPLGDMFRRLFHRWHEGLTLVTPSSSARNMLSAGMELLRALCPKLAPSAMRHVHLIAVVAAGPGGRFTSLTNPRVPATFFLSPSVLTNPWQAAEFMLHEAMHVKFVDLEHTHSLLADDYDAASSPMIRPHWNRVTVGNVNDWPISRTLTVLHVYVSLAVFFNSVVDHRAGLEPRFGPVMGMDPVKQARRALDRARYLQEQLGRYEEHLGFAGRLFVRWLGDNLGILDGCPPPRGAYVHLLLDLYERECEELEALVRRGDDNVFPDEAVWAEALRERARVEIERTRAALSLVRAGGSIGDVPVGGEREQAALRDGGASFKDNALALLSVRRGIASSLRAIDPRAFVSGEGLRAAGMVREMVENSDDHLGALLDRASG